jgi:transcriptional regulator with XRE-family HTH domain
MVESLGPLLARVRSARGWSQLRVAELLCAASGTPTVTRNELSRWEREERIASAFWLGWLALVLDVPVETLTAAAAVTRRGRARPAWDRLDRKTTAAEPAGLGPQAADG